MPKSKPPRKKVTKEKINKIVDIEGLAKKRSYEFVEIPEWEGGVYIRPVGLVEMASWGEEDSKKTSSEQAEGAIRLLMSVLAKDSKGTPLMEDSDKLFTFLNSEMAVSTRLINKITGVLSDDVPLPQSSDLNTD